jgi:cytoskeletal protein RodZ
VENWQDKTRTGSTHETSEVTVQLDGRKLAELTSELEKTPSPTEADGPVFVDESGKRSRKLRKVGWILAAVFSCYAVVLVFSVIGGNASAPWLGIPGQSEEKQADTVVSTEGASPSAAASPTESASAPAAPTATSSAVVDRPTVTATRSAGAGVVTSSPSASSSTVVESPDPSVSPSATTLPTPAGSPTASPESSPAQPSDPPTSPGASPSDTAATGGESGGGATTQLAAEGGL